MGKSNLPDVRGTSLGLDKNANNAQSNNRSKKKKTIYDCRNSRNSIWLYDGVSTDLCRFHLL